ncbi:hypothetical protein SDC9_196035 [bioreactor metagenome]|uniref:Uncharacterized protein n=1 Tax=bioreactor metagenome TaxID=1076179 RepID=A0A645IAX8_9ZZZZ
MNYPNFIDRDLKTIKNSNDINNKTKSSCLLHDIVKAHLDLSKSKGLLHKMIGLSTVSRTDFIRYGIS